ncbi:MAG: hypothetical protein A3F09_06195 [Chlamydiae bacterium RIFCSPHIGHO2_12_FULL_49_11]|nr:MAG: hypothetical protein A3F09_06195 [Chlamydiae bacterium RIFCSPHIGHO2_12_FULL_49_11]
MAMAKKTPNIVELDQTLSCCLHELSLLLYYLERQHCHIKARLHYFLPLSNAGALQTLFFTAFAKISSIRKGIAALIPLQNHFTDHQVDLLKKLLFLSSALDEKEPSVFWTIVETVRGEEELQGVIRPLIEYKKLLLAWKQEGLESTLSLFEKSL